MMSNSASSAFRQGASSNPYFTFNNNNLSHVNSQLPVTQNSGGPTLSTLLPSKIQF
jgi:hypothetical protein